VHDTKSGKRRDTAVRIAWQSACDLGFRGTLGESERLMGQRPNGDQPKMIDGRRSRPSNFPCRRFAGFDSVKLRLFESLLAVAIAFAVATHLSASIGNTSGNEPNEPLGRLAEWMPQSGVQTVE
jgi:hypothetical protein